MTTLELAGRSTGLAITLFGVLTAFAAVLGSYLDRRRR